MPLTSLVALALASSAGQAPVQPGIVIMRKPIELKLPTVSEGWRTGPWSDVSGQCGIVKRTRTVTCGSASGVCTGAKPAESEDAIGGGQDCEYRWSAGEYGAWSSSCSPSAVRLRPITCVDRSGQQVEGSSCEIAYKPDPVETQARYDNCGYEWVTSPWSGSCAGTEPRTRTVQCVLSLYDMKVEDAKCADIKPATEQPISATDRCDNQWRSGEWTDWSSHCSDTATRTRTVECIDENGGVIAPEQCSANQKPKTSQTSAVTDACEAGEQLTYHWRIGEYGAFNSACSPAAERIRPVDCVDQNGQVVSAGQCTEPRPEAKETMPVYSDCQFRWATDPWQPWSSQCSAEAERTRAVSCIRTDGNLYAEETEEANCPASDKPATSETGENYAACTYAWKTGEYVVTPACGQTTATRPVTCERIGSDGEIGSDAQCSGPKPEATKTVDDRSACTYEWQVGPWSGWDSTCSVKARRERVQTCYRMEDSTPVDSGLCSGKAGFTLAETAEITSSCSYGWVSTPNGEWHKESQCSPTESRTVTVSCQRSDGTEADSTLCTSVRPADVETRAASSCEASWRVEYEAEKDVCGTASKTGTVSCVREDGQVVDDSQCVASKRPSNVAEYTNYRSCTYAWHEVPLGGWDSGCANNSVPNVSIECRRSDGTEAPGKCDSQTKPTPSQAINTSQCDSAFLNVDFEAPAASKIWAPTGSSGDPSIITTAPLSPNGGSLAGVNNGMYQTSAIPLKYKSRYRVEFWGYSGGTSSTAPTLKLSLTNGSATSAIATHAGDKTISLDKSWQYYTVTLNPAANGDIPDSAASLTLKFISNARGARVDGVTFYAIAP